MDRLTRVFSDGIGTAAATSGVLTQLQGRIFGLLFVRDAPMSLDDICAELQQSKSNVSVQIRGLVDWQLVRQLHVAGSRRDHYEAATDFWRVLQEIVERRFRWNLRQVLATVDETERALTGERSRTRRALVQDRMDSIRAYFLSIDALLAALTAGEPMTSARMRSVATRVSSPSRARLTSVRITGRGSRQQ